MSFKKGYQYIMEIIFDTFIYMTPLNIYFIGLSILSIITQTGVFPFLDIFVTMLIISLIAILIKLSKCENINVKKYIKHERIVEPFMYYIFFLSFTFMLIKFLFTFYPIFTLEYENNVEYLITQFIKLIVGIIILLTGMFQWLITYYILNSKTVLSILSEEKWLYNKSSDNYGKDK